jgi:hypothetical protein
MLFSFVFLFYWILPIFAGLTMPIIMDDIPAGWNYFFLSLSPETLTKYLSSCALLYGAFVLADTLGVRYIRPRTIRAEPLSKVALAIVTVAGVALSAYGIISLRGLLFEAYSTDLDGQYARGTVTAYIILLGVVALLYAADHRESSFARTLRSPLVIPFFLGCLLLLSIGSRLYVATFLLIFVVFKSNFRGTFRLRAVLWGGAVLALSFGLIGAIRIGSAPTESLLYVLYEPVLTSLSLVYYLRYDQIRLLNVPTYLVSDFSNLIPSVLWPRKADVLQTPTVYSPLGAINSFVSFNIYFGVLGTAILMFVLPVFLRNLVSRKSMQFAQISYVILSGSLAFTFFRDPISVSFVKVMFEDAILFPAVIVGFSRLLQRSVKRRCLSEYN